LLQTEYVRNIIDPENFARYNDGIIQASILRAAHPLELAYEIDKEISRKFLSIIVPIITHAKDHYGEALLEFLFAIAIRKLRLEISCLKEFMSLVKKECKEQEVIQALCHYIERAIINKEPEIVTKYSTSYNLN